jgi:hypothetical protein
VLRGKTNQANSSGRIGPRARSAGRKKGKNLRQCAVLNRIGQPPAAAPLQQREPERSRARSKNTPELPPDFQGQHEPLNLEITNAITSAITNELPLQLPLQLTLKLTQATTSTCQGCDRRCRLSAAI